MSLKQPTFLNNFMIGIGAGAYNYFGMGAHNDYIQILAENGIITGLLFFSFVLFNLASISKKYICTKNSDDLLFFGLQLFFILNAFTATSFLHFGFFWIYLQCCVASEKTSGEMYARFDVDPNPLLRTSITKVRREKC